MSGSHFVATLPIVELYTKPPIVNQLLVLDVKLGNHQDHPVIRIPPPLHIVDVEMFQSGPTDPTLPSLDLSHLACVQTHSHTHSLICASLKVIVYELQENSLQINRK